MDNVEQRMIWAVLEKPTTITIDGKYYCLYPPSVGVLLLSGELLRLLEFDKNLLAFAQAYELLRVCSEHRDVVVRLIAMHTFQHRSDALNEEKLQNRIGSLSKLNTADIATLFVSVLQWQGLEDELTKHIGLDFDKRNMEKVRSVKDDRNNISFGGKSIYGNLLDFACARYGWEYGYCLWGVSAVNLNMMLKDSVQSVYLSDKERKQAHISNDNRRIEATAEGAKELLNLLRGK